MIVKKIILSLISLFLICLIINFSRQIFRLWQVSKTPEKRREIMTALEKKNKELREELEAVKSQAFVEKTAREKLGMNKEGERVVIIPIITNNPINTNKTNGGIEPNWRKWWRLFVD